MFFGPAFRPKLREFFDLAVKLSHAQQAVHSMERYKTEGKYPPNVMGALKLPVMQVSKEFNGTQEHHEFASRLVTAVDSVRLQFLDHLIEGKSAEVLHLAAQISHSRCEAAARLVGEEAVEQISLLYVTTGIGDKNVVLPDFVQQEIKYIAKSGQSWFHKACCCAGPEQAPDGGDC